MQVLKQLSFLLLFQISFLFAGDKPIFTEITYLKLDSIKWDFNKGKHVKCDMTDPRFGSVCPTIYIKIVPNVNSYKYPLVDMFSRGMNSSGRPHRTFATSCKLSYLGPQKHQHNKYKIWTNACSKNFGGYSYFINRKNLSWCRARYSNCADYGGRGWVETSNEEEFYSALEAMRIDVEKYDKKVESEYKI